MPKVTVKVKPSGVQLQFPVGSLVERVGCCNKNSAGEVNVGESGTVTGHDGAYVDVKFDSGLQIFNDPQHLRLLAMPFMVGDRVDTGEHGLGTVVEDEESYPSIKVQHDTWREGWGQDKQYHFYCPESLKHVETPTMKAIEKITYSADGVDVPAQETVEAVLRGQFPHGHPRFVSLTLAEMELHSVKNHDYAAGGDPLGSFKRVAAFFSMYPGLKLSDPAVAAMAYAMKQVDAYFWLKSNGHTAKVEGIAGRLPDISVYTKLAQILEGEKAA